MERTFSTEERRRIQVGITARYRNVAVNPEGEFAYPTGRVGLAQQGYDPKILKALPQEILASYCGVGNPFSLGPIHKGEAVLDIGCGAGVDTLVAATLVGPEGRVIGMDLSPEMLERANMNLRKTSLGNVSFREGSAEELPWADASFDVALSNGVFNLVPDKPKALQEIFRVLKPHGRFMIADQVLMADSLGDTQSRVESWAG